MAALGSVVLALAVGCGSVGDPERGAGDEPATATGPSATPTVREPAAPPAGAEPAAPQPQRPDGWRAALAQLRVAEPSSRDGYDRDRFGGWIDADADRCDTRCEVLLREFRRDLDDLPVGGWLSVYDGVRTAESSELDVDHTVALAEAWISGADRWDDARRREFANDLSPGALRAVTASVNRSKSDRDPAEWQPPDRSSWCTFATDWVSTKLRWDLSADPREFTTLTTMLESCP